MISLLHFNNNYIYIQFINNKHSEEMPERFNGAKISLILLVKSAADSKKTH
jgi:hypothetical protein